MEVDEVDEVEVDEVELRARVLEAPPVACW